MAHGSGDVAARLSEIYKGIEGFYFLNRSGRLGYLSSDGTRMHAERLNGIAADRASPFLEALAGAVEASPLDADQELGYLLPVDDAHVWKTATLVLHDHVASALKDAFDRDISKGRLSLAEGDRRVPDMAAERGLHRGFEDLLNHIGSFGTQPWFPVLHVRPVTTENPTHPVRVVNLLALMKDVGRFADILAKMRQNLSERGALNQASRVEHRFTLQDEV
ncbi:MAG: hypothetical protein U5R46_02660 [Gammaproteobacteria bacterium]|nr:hypothetical protein [Gammaproteobacteria bacterium]